MPLAVSTIKPAGGSVRGMIAGIHSMPFAATVENHGELA